MEFFYSETFFTLLTIGILLICVLNAKVIAEALVALLILFGLAIIIGLIFVILLTVIVPLMIVIIPIYLLWYYFTYKI